MKKRTLFKTFLIDATAALLAVCVTVVPAFGDSIDLKPLIAKMPAQTEAEGRVVFEAILKGGKPAILAACECLTPPSQGGDAKVQYLLGGLAFYVARTGAETERQLYSEAIMEAIQKVKDRDVKAFLLELLRWCGGRECLVPLTAILADDYLVDPATRVLVAIHAPGTDAVLLKALADSEGARALTLVKAVGELRVEGAIPLIAKFATSGDTDTRRTALQALADIVPVDKSRRTGPGAPAEVLKKACQSTDLLEKSFVTAMYVHHAARLAESGSAAQGAAICREVMAFASEPGVSHLVPPAFETLARIEGAKCVADLITFVNSPDRKMRVAAMKTLISMKNSKSGAELNRILTKGPADLRIALMSALKDTDQEAHADAIVGNLKSDNQDVRNAAIQVLASRRKVADLIEYLQTCNDGDIPELRKAFLTVVEQKDQKKLSTVLGHASAPARVLALEILGMRRATACYGAIAEASRDTNSLVRLAAMVAMGPTASAENLPTLIRLYQSVTDSSEQAAVLRSAVQASKMVSEQEQRAELFLGALLSAPPERKEAIISILPEVGGEKALQVVVAMSRISGDPLQNSAIRALASWPDAVAIKAILEIAKSSPVLNQQVLLLRGFVRLVQADAQPPETKLGLYKEALTLAKRPEEKSLILGTLVDIKTLAALQMALESGAPSTNLALRKKVTTSVPQMGIHAPECAVDGKAENDSAWWGVRYPASLQVDLEKSFTIDLARVVFYSDNHRYYQYTIDVSQDGATWKSVADHSRDTSPSPWEGQYVQFPAIDARYVRLNILTNSVNESVHVAEFEVFEKGKGPAELMRDKDGFLSLFNGKDLTGWTGDMKGYVAEDGRLICRTAGNLLTKRIYTNFVFRFEFKLTPGANNGIAFRAPAGSDGGPKGEEIQILDDTAPEFKNLHDYQYHGSLYGVVPCKRGHQKPVGEWNEQEVMADGSKLKITLNGVVIVDADLSTITQTPQIHDLKGHPGLHNPAGRIGFLGHVPLSGLEFRNIRMKEL